MKTSNISQNAVLLAALAIGACLPGCDAQASGWVDLHIGSVHLEPTVPTDEGDYELNENNLGIGLTHDIPNNPFMSVRLGTYENSYNATTYYAGIHPHTNQEGWLVAGVILGVASGYDVYPNETTGKLIPLVVPTLALQNRYVRAELTLLLAETPAIGLSVGIRY